MIYDFSFSNTSKDESFFLYILAQSAQNLHLNAFFYTHNQQTHCFIPDLAALLSTQEDSPSHNLLQSFCKQDINYAQNILAFANDMAQNLPLSLYFAFLELKPITPPQAFYEALNTLQPQASLKEIFTHTFRLLFPQCPKDTPLNEHLHIIASFHTPKTYYYTPAQTSEILNPLHEHFAKLNPPSAVHKKLLEKDKAYFINIVNELKAGKDVPFCTTFGTELLSLTPKEDTHTTLLCDIASLKTYFRTHQARIDILASFEKPTTRLVPKEVFESQFPLDKCGLTQVGLPYDMPLAIIGALLLQDEIGYFFLSPCDKEPDFDFKHSQRPRAQNLAIAQNGIFIDTYITPDNTLYSLIESHLKAEPGEACLVAYLSSRHPSAFLIQGEGSKILLNIAFETNPRLILEDIARSYKSGDELLKNFGKHFPELLSAALNMPPTPKPSNNLLDILDSAAFVLGLKTPHQSTSDKNALFYHAYRFVRERGPRIDYKLLREDNMLLLDYNRIIRSCMSFKCAKMEDEILSFGALDSLSEFVATLARDTLTNLALNKILLLGDMLSNHIFLDKILEYLPKNIQLLLPKDGLIDY